MNILLKIISYWLLFLFSSGLMAKTQGNIACRYYNPKSQIRKNSFAHPGLPWVWARGEGGEQIQALGYTKDGFFIPTKIYSASHKQTYGIDISVARDLCHRALRKAFPESYQDISMLEISVKKSFLSLKHQPIVFSELSRPTVGIDRLVIFGDSLSDQGNLKNWLRLYPPEPYCAGRFSDGPVWIDYLARMSGMGVQNWAIGGSVSRKFKDFTFDTHKLRNKFNIATTAQISGSLRKQIKRYGKKSLKNKMVTNADTTLYVIWIGGNDYLYPLNSASDTDIFIDQPSDPRIGSNTVIERVVSSIAVNIQELYRLGARKFLVINLADMGVMPKIPFINYYHQKETQSHDEKTVMLSKALTQISNRHNARLRAQLTQFDRFKDDINLIQMDAFSKLADIFQAGSTPTRSPLIEHGLDKDFARSVYFEKDAVTINKACYYGTIWGARTGKRCADPSRLLFFDEVHPSSFAHCWSGYLIHQHIHQSGLLPVPYFRDYLAMCKPELAVMD